jgi:hypothetical protein
MKTIGAIIVGFLALSAFIIVTDWLAIHAGNIVGPLALTGIVAGLWFALTRWGRLNG